MGDYLNIRFKIEYKIIGTKNKTLKDFFPIPDKVELYNEIHLSKF